MLRVLHCPTPTGGHSQLLARAERELGLHSTAVIWRQDAFAFPADEVLCPPTAHPLQRERMRFYSPETCATRLRYCPFQLWSDTHATICADAGADAFAISTLVVLGVWALCMAFGDAGSPLLKRAGKGIVVTYQGDDARQGDFCQTHFAISPMLDLEPGYYTPASDARKRWRIAQFATYADRIYALNPDLLHVLPAQAEFLPYTNVDLRAWRPALTQEPQAKRLTLLHAPTHRGVKGTRYVLEAVQQLREHDQLDIELLLVEGLSHEEARRSYQRADLLIDQLLVGWYGGLAVECMALGKPVVCYIREEDLKFIPVQMRRDLPIIQATPATLYTVLKTWLTVRRDELRQAGHQGRMYVEQWHDPLQIAAKLQREYEAILASKP